MSSDNNQLPKTFGKNHSKPEAPLLRRVIITEKIKLLLTLYGPLPPPFLLSKAEASCSPPLPLPPKVSKKKWSFRFNGMP